MPAYGQENSPPPISENPPLSGLDTLSLEPHAAPLSYLQPGATISESADSNVANSPGGGSVRSITRGLGSVTLHRLWSNYDLALDYVGGVGYYNLKGLGWRALQQMDIDQKITWKRGQLSLARQFQLSARRQLRGKLWFVGLDGDRVAGQLRLWQFLGSQQRWGRWGWRREW